MEKEELRDKLLDFLNASEFQEIMKSLGTGTLEIQIGEGYHLEGEHVVPSNNMTIYGLFFQPAKEDIYSGVADSFYPDFGFSFKLGAPQG